MKFTLSWLKKFLDTNASLDEISKTLTSLGLEVESITDRSKTLEAFTIAEILEADQHPNADRLRICKVSTGEEILNIVCGAANARTGIKVVLAKLGTTLPNGMLIKQTKIRGIDSFGMLCSSEELGLGKLEDGIIELSGEAKVGDKFLSMHQELTDPVIEVSITPNRGDCFGVYGIARDLAASGLGKLNPLPNPIKHKKLIPNPVKVKIEDTKICPAFVGRYFSGVKNCESPKWLKDLFRAIGEDSISALVDITNYICYSFGRPLHVFDAQKIQGNLIVRKANKDERLEALNEKIYNLTADDIVIADDKNILSIAGIMGGKASGCYLPTTEVFLESALFDQATITATGRKHMIDSDARQRFERGVDKQFVTIGAELASNLILEMCGGSCSEYVIAGSVEYEPKKIIFDLAKLESLSGLSIKLHDAKNILEKLGFICHNKNNSLECIVPSWRNDINIPEDLIEELLRIKGYDIIPALKLPTKHLTQSVLTKQQKLLNQTRKVLIASGLNEVITWSFMSSKNSELFAPIIDELKILNPISTDLDIMRSTILPNLIELVQKNHNRSLQNLAFFEIGPVFTWEKNQYQQNKIIAGIRFGDIVQKNWHKDLRSVDIFDAKSDLYRILSIFNINVDNCELDAKDLPDYYHPARSACIKLKEKTLGFFGEIHPRIQAKFDLPNEIVAFECLVENLVDGKKAISNPISDFQPVQRDFAFLLNLDTMVGEVSNTIKKADNLIKEVSVFDVYHDDKLTSSGKKSVAFSVKLQASHNLDTSEINMISTKIIDLVKQKFEAELR
jgi:phenylalanyl-tRNA synthetase beta chain